MKNYFEQICEKLNSKIKIENIYHPKCIDFYNIQNKKICDFLLNKSFENGQRLGNMQIPEYPVKAPSSKH